MKRNHAAVFLAASLFLSLLAGCGKADSKSGLTPVTLNEVAHSIFYAPQYAAIELGYFEEEGIDLTLVNGAGADKVMTAIASNSADIGLMGPEATIYCHVEGQRNYPVIFGQLTACDGSFLVGRNPEPDFKWENLENKHILAGRAGGVPAMTLQYVCNSAGLYHDKNINLDTTVAFDLMVGAFEGDTKYDYVTMFEPTASEYQAAGKGYIVASVGAAAGSVPYTAFSASKSYLEKNRDTALAVLRAVVKGYKDLIDNPSDKVAPALEASFVGTPLASIAAAIDSYREIGAWSSTPVMKEEDFDHLMDIMENAGTLSSRADFDLAVDNSLAKEVIA